MSDEERREAERRFTETGSAEDEVAWLCSRARSGENLDWESYSRLHELDVEAAADYLRWRVETGELTRERLVLGGHCGHEAASRVCGQVASANPAGDITRVVHSLPNDDGALGGWASGLVLRVRGALPAEERVLGTRLLNLLPLGSDTPELVELVSKLEVRCEDAFNQVLEEDCSAVRCNVLQALLLLQQRDLAGAAEEVARAVGNAVSAAGAQDDEYARQLSALVVALLGQAAEAQAAAFRLPLPGWPFPIAGCEID
ncbi:MAG TPA: hypothetical protein DEA08_24415 [Planctomycetes bacterium]|nr:hypothetical protein [Planctomycetota bacterium]